MNYYLDFFLLLNVGTSRPKLPTMYDVALWVLLCPLVSLGSWVLCHSKLCPFYLFFNLILLDHMNTFMQK